MREQTIKATVEGKIIAILRNVKPEDIPKVAGALCDGGIGMVEVTFNQAQPGSFADTAGGIAAIREQLGGRVLAGAGTVMSIEQVELAVKAGADYIISPHVDEAVIRKTRELGLVSMPGAMTASEAVAAVRCGADFVKLFPAGNLGPGYLKALYAPLSHIRFLAVGGIDETNAAAFLAAGAVGLGIGGKLVDKACIEAGAYHKITQRAKQYMEAVQG